MGVAGPFPCVSAENLLHPDEAGAVAGAGQLRQMRERRPASRRSSSTTVRGGDALVLPSGHIMEASLPPLLQGRDSSRYGHA